MGKDEDAIKRSRKLAVMRQMTYRAKQAAQGRCLVSVWVPCADKTTIRALAQHLCAGGRININLEES